MAREIAVFYHEPIQEEQVAHVGLFRGVNFAGIEAQIHQCPLMDLEAGRELIAPGQPEHVLYLVLSGRLLVYADTERQQQIGTIDRGECIGAFSMVDRKPCSVMVVTEQRCRFLVLDEDRFTGLVNSSAFIGRNFLFILMHYLRNKDRDAPEHQRMEQRIARENRVDDVTGIYNRRWLDEMIDRQVMRCSRANQPLSLIAVDIIDLHTYNEDYSRRAGDQALYTVAQILQAAMRPTDIVTRYEGDHFIILLPNTELLAAQGLARRLQQTISQTEITIPGECVLPAVSVEMSAYQMKSFVSGARLISDTLAGLPKNAANDPQFNEQAHGQSGQRD